MSQPNPSASMPYEQGEQEQMLPQNKYWRRHKNTPAQFYWMPKCLVQTIVSPFQHESTTSTRQTVPPASSLSVANCPHCNSRSHVQKQTQPSHPHTHVLLNPSWQERSPNWLLTHFMQAKYHWMYPTCYWTCLLTMTKATCCHKNDMTIDTYFSSLYHVFGLKCSESKGRENSHMI